MPASIVLRRFRSMPKSVRPIALGLLLALVAGLLAMVPEPAIAEPGSTEALTDRSVAVQVLEAAQADEPEMPDDVPGPEPVWPEEHTALVDLGGLSTGSATASTDAAAPVFLAAVTGSDMLSGQKLFQSRRGLVGLGLSPAAVRVHIAGRDLAKQLGIPGVVFALSRADRAGTAAPVRVDFDYSSFANAYGADYSARLRLVQLPSCALTTPELAECQTTSQLSDARNDFASSRLRVDSVSVAGDSSGDAFEGAGGKSAAAPAQQMTVLAAMSSSSSMAGDFTKTDLTSSSQWSAGLSSGEFAWSYPVPVPPVASGLMPEVALSYSSGSVDGRTAGEHTQPGVLGEGWSYSPGFIERTYRPCSDDTANSPVHTSLNNKPDLCWRLPNAQVNLNGKTSEIVLGDDGKWRLAQDDGEKVELLTGADNNDDNGEHWKITTVDGTQYWFGLHHLPGRSSSLSTESTAKTTVWANHSGEPCFTSTFAYSKCKQAYRWMLDYVVDVNGNEMSFWYGHADNRAQLQGSNGSWYYHRDIWLKRIEYGTHVDDAGSVAAPARVAFSYADRCLTTSCATKDATNWPDTPWDLECLASPCHGNPSPSYWSSQRLDEITTQVRSGGSYQDADRVQLTFQFPATGDGSSPVLWLSQLKRTGVHADGTELAQPSVSLWGVRLQNRADYDPNAGMRSHNKWRIAKLRNESGHIVEITYSNDQPGCRFGDNFPDPDNNNARCFPQYYVPESAPPGWSWWHKRYVDQVVEKDLTGGSPDIVHDYFYSTASSDTNVLWGYSAGAAVWGSPNGGRSWNDWRGYSNVTVKTGLASGTRSQTEYVFFRGLHGDRTDSGTRSVKLNAYSGSWSDSLARRGHLMNEIIYDQAGGQAVQVVQYEPWEHETGERTLSSLWAVPSVFKSWLSRTASTKRWAADDIGVLKQRQAVYDTWGESYGRLLAREDRGVFGADDTTCTKYEYVYNPSKHMWSYQRRERLYAVPCNGELTDPNLLSDHAWRYDGGGYGDAPTKGNVTVDYVLPEVGGSWVYLAQSVTHDRYGRVTYTADGLGRGTSTAYTEDAAGRTATVSVTNAAGHAISSNLEVTRGLPTSVTDANGKTTTATYDPLGRLTSVVKPGNSSGLPDVEYTYNLRYTAPSYVRSRILGPNGNQITSYEIYDGMLRLRQSQSTAPDGKRVIVDTQYDARSQAAKNTVFYNADSGPSSTLVGFNDSEVDRQTRFSYDGRGRQVSAETWSQNSLKWKTTTAYALNQTTIIPPYGGTTVTDVFDDLGRLKEKRQHHSANPAAAYDVTGYAYNLRGELTGVTDPAGNQWSYDYNMLGWQLQASDPDAGTTVKTYDGAGQLISTTDARGQALHYEYDQLGRKIRQRQDAADGPIRAEWTYDTIAKGQLSSAIRFDGGQAYASQVTAYDDAYRPLTTEIVIPAAEGDLAGTYTTSTTYKTSGAVATQTMPGWGGLPDETLTHTYTDTGMLASMSGVDEYLAQVAYTWDGQIAQSTHGAAGKQVQETFTYGPDTGRLDIHQIDVEDTASPGSWLDKFTTEYGYDPAGNIGAIAGKTDGIRDQVECFTYDHLRRLTEAHTKATWDCGAEPVGGGAGADSYWRQWTFDTIGNRLAQTDKGASGDTIWTYNTGSGYGVSAHQLASVTASGPLAQIPTRSFTYDPAGNMTARTTETGNSQTLSWTANGRLGTLTEGTDVTEYIYDADGNRLIQRSPDATTLYLGDTELEDSASGGSVLGTRYYAGYAVRSAAGLRWICTDRHGTGQVQIDSVTLEAYRQRSMPYGEERGTQASEWLGTRGYVGGTKDETGLTHLGAREYDPTLGRFISVDPIMDLTDPQQWHAYTYSNGSPVTWSDPSGLIMIGDNDGKLTAQATSDGQYWIVEDNTSDDPKDHSRTKVKRNSNLKDKDGGSGGGGEPENIVYVCTASNICTIRPGDDSTRAIYNCNGARSCIIENGGRGPNTKYYCNVQFSCDLAGSPTGALGEVVCRANPCYFLPPRSTRDVPSEWDYFWSWGYWGNVGTGASAGGALGAAGGCAAGAWFFGVGCIAGAGAGGLTGGAAGGAIAVVANAVEYSEMKDPVWVAPSCGTTATGACSPGSPEVFTS